MKIANWAIVAGTAILASAPSSQGQAADSDVELAFMPSTMTVALLNEGGKYVTVDLKHIPQGGSCRMDKDAVIMRVGSGASGMTRVRFAAPQMRSGGCPFLTDFDMSDADYSAARAAIVQMKDDASKKVDDLKKQLGDKWDEVTGNKK
jgi:hypothetical protein